MTDKEYVYYKKFSEKEKEFQLTKTRGKVRSVIFALLMAFLVSSYVVEGNIRLLPTINTVSFGILILLFIFVYWFLNKKPKQISK